MIMGMNGFVWWQGVVEDRDDPLKLGRCRVRILGLDTERKNLDQNRGIPTDELLWAYPMQPITSAAMNGIGDAPVGLVQGTWVFGFFRDGENGQDPVMIGTVGGIPQTAPNTSMGFNDPDGVYPKTSHLMEPDTNRLARNEKINETIVQTKRNTRDTNIPTAGFNTVGPTYNEPEVPYDARYPFNKVNESESGHIHEIDDTPEHERLQTYHKSGTFEEIHPDGTVVRKIVGDGYQIVTRNNNVYIKGAMNITVDGNANMYVKGNVVQQVDMNVDQHVKGNVRADIDGTTVITAERQVQIDVNSSALITTQADCNITSMANVRVTATNTAQIQAADIRINATNSATIDGGTNLTLNATNLTCTGTGIATFTGGTVVVG